MGVGADAAAEAADIALMRDSLHGVADAVGLSRAALTKIRQNLFSAFVYLQCAGNTARRALDA